MRLLLIYSSILYCITLTPSAFALTLKFKQENSDNRVVLATSDSVQLATGKRSKATASGKSAQLAVLAGTGVRSAVIAYKRGKRLLSARTVLNSRADFCSDGSLLAYTGVKGNRARINLKDRDAGDIVYHAGRVVRGKAQRASELSSKSLTGLVLVGGDCLPSGTGLTLGLPNTLIFPAQMRELKQIPSDQDLDGLIDILDIDADNDGIIKNFDSEPGSDLPGFRVFSNLKVGIENSLNVSALGREPTKEEVDQLTANTTLAIEVKAASGEESELDCNGLSYCSAGGTGTVLNTSDAFPGSPGGVFDSDSDGNGTIVAGSTGDFQLATNLTSFDQLNAGDAYVQTVASSGSASLRTFISSLQFAYRSTPAMKSLTMDPDGDAVKTTFSYPVAQGSSGTPGNCIPVFLDTDGDVVLEIEAWRPQRKGIAVLGEADFVDLGNSVVSIDLPNAPSAGAGAPSAGPGLCPVDTLSTSDGNLSAAGDGLQDSFGDQDANPANLVSFRVNITDCLASAGQVFAAGETLKVDLQFRNSVGDNAAQAFCIGQFD